MKVTKKFLERTRDEFTMEDALKFVPAETRSLCERNRAMRKWQLEWAYAVSEMRKAFRQRWSTEADKLGVVK